MISVVMFLSNSLLCKLTFLGSWQCSCLTLTFIVVKYQQWKKYRPFWLTFWPLHQYLLFYCFKTSLIRCWCWEVIKWLFNSIQIKSSKITVALYCKCTVSSVVNTHIRIGIHKDTYMHISIHKHTCIHTYMHTQTYMYTCIGACY